VDSSNLMNVIDGIYVKEMHDKNLDNDKRIRWIKVSPEYEINRVVKKTLPKDELRELLEK